MRQGDGLVGRAHLQAADLPFTSESNHNTGREENETYWHPVTASLLALSSPVRLIADLVDFDPGRTVELGVLCVDLN
jgi:hypothetical protein